MVGMMDIDREEEQLLHFVCASAAAAALLALALPLSLLLLLLFIRRVFAVATVLAVAIHRCRC